MPYTAIVLDDLVMRSKLFVPASRPELFAKAMAGEADSIAFDLEDAVSEDRKEEARANLRAFLQSLEPGSGKTIVVRVNAIGTPHFAADVESLADTPVDLVNLPKPESPASVRACAEALARHEGTRRQPPIGILVNIETPRALRIAAELATASPRVVGLQAGWGDLLEPLGMDRYRLATIEWLLLAIRIAAGEAGVWAYDAAFPNIRDPEGYTREADAARSLGYVGKSCIHPSQVPLANAVFRPQPAEIAHSLRVIAAARAAAAQGVGAFAVDGRMVDGPFIRRAETVVALARQLKLIAPDEDSAE